MENIMYEDNVPGVLGNCALLSALNILCNSQNPKIIAKYVKEDGVYKFIDTYNS